MGCQSCGFPAAIRADRCPYCGTSLASAALQVCYADDDWEYRELFIPLGLKVRPGHLESEDRRRIEETIGLHLRRAAAAGWEPAVETDWHTLRASGFARRARGPSLGSSSTLHYESVRVPMRRLERH